MNTPLDRRPLVSVEGVSKSYGGVRALDSVSMQIAAGEVHALCGENGAGKSTLIKILSGSVTPDTGTITVNGELLPLGNVSDSEVAGIAVIHQESVAFPHLDAQDNIFIGREPRTAGVLLDRPQMLAETQRLLARLGEPIDPWKPLGDLPIAQRQMVAIARALSHQCKLLIMDEPTASLSARETEVLFRIIRQLKAEGVSILYVSHRMEEIFLLSDRVTVLRDGRHVTTTPTTQITQDELIRLMVGRELLKVEMEVKSDQGHDGRDVLLEVDRLGRSDAFRDVSLRVRSGEIVGMAGLVGAGRSDVALAIFGATRADTGSVSVQGRTLLPGSIDAAKHAGVALVPEDRQHQGLVLPMSVRANLSMPVIDRLTTAGIISSARERALFEELISALHVKTATADVPAQTLSGGNQQKLVIGKWLATKPRVLILDEPTRGVDVGAKSEIYKLIRGVAAQGMAVLVVSSDLPEVLLLSDRILVMRGGEIAGELTRHEATQEKVLALAMPGATMPRDIGAMLATTSALSGGRGTAILRTLASIAAKREYALAILLAVIIAAVTIRSPTFLAPGNLRDILVNCVQPAIIACGVMLVIVTAEIDISVGAAMGFLTALLGIMVSPTHLGWPVWAGVLLTLGIGALIGLTNGLFVTIARVPSIIVTLAMLMMLQSVTVMIMWQGNITDLPAGMRYFGIGELLHLRVSIWIAAATIVATSLMLRYTPMGRRIFAVGSNAHAASLAGLSARNVKVFAFTATGFLVGLATIVTQLATVDNGIGAGMELLIVTCVVVGGVSISGGRGTVAGVMLAVLLLSIQKTVLIFLNLGAGSANWDRAIQGGLILAAVLVDHAANRRRSLGGQH